jgi:hypothetical protein
MKAIVSCRPMRPNKMLDEAMNCGTIAIDLKREKLAVSHQMTENTPRNFAQLRRQGQSSWMEGYSVASPPRFYGRLLAGLPWWVSLGQIPLIIRLVAIPTSSIAHQALRSNSRSQFSMKLLVRLCISIVYTLSGSSRNLSSYPLFAQTAAGCQSLTLA